MKPKSKFKYLLITCFSVLLLLIFGGWVQKELSAGKEAVKSPKQILEAYMAYINEGNYAEMYQLLDESSQAQISLEAFVEKNQKIYEGIEAANLSITVTDLGEDQTDNSQRIVSFETRMDTLAGELTCYNLK